MGGSAQSRPISPVSPAPAPASAPPKGHPVGESAPSPVAASAAKPAATVLAGTKLAPAASAATNMKLPINVPASIEGFGEHLFWGAVAEKYLSKQGMTFEALKAGMWVHDTPSADKVAAAVLQWGKDNGASSFCHWFQPLCSTNRHGQSGQVQNAMFEFDAMRKPVWELKGKHLLRGETDGSSYFNGGLRATHTAGGYLTIGELRMTFCCLPCRPLLRRIRTDILGSFLCQVGFSYADFGLQIQ